MSINQSEFILSLVGKKTDELHKIVIETVHEGLVQYKKMYIVDSCADGIRKMIDLYKSVGYTLQTRLNMCLELLSVIEENEYKRMMYSELLKNCCFTADTFLTIAESQYKNQMMNNLVNIEKYAKLISLATNEEMLSQYRKEIERAETFDKQTIINAHNHRISNHLYYLVRIKTTIEKTANGGTEYL
jgi:hypothetical protein